MTMDREGGRERGRREREREREREGESDIENPWLEHRREEICRSRFPLK